LKYLMAPKITPIYAATYECGRQLAAAGCPIDYLDKLPRNPAKHGKKLRMREIGGYTESRLFDYGPHRGSAYLICLGLSTDLPGGVIIDDWSFKPPWSDHLVSWDYAAQDILPEQDRFCYEKLFGPRLAALLNDRRVLTRSRPVEGLLCGRAVESIPTSVASCADVVAKLTVRLDTGDTFTLPISLAVYRVHRKTERRPARKRLFDTLIEKNEEPNRRPSSSTPSTPATISEEGENGTSLPSLAFQR
jgi:hypothetical protein